MLFGTGLGRHLPKSWQIWVTRLLSPSVTYWRTIRLNGRTSTPTLDTPTLDTPTLNTLTPDTPTPDTPTPDTPTPDTPTPDTPTPDTPPPDTPTPDTPTPDTPTPDTPTPGTPTPDMPPPDTPTPVEGVNGQLRRYSTDSLSILPTNNLRLNHPADLGISNNIVISLTTTPTRATSQEIFDVLDSLVMQRRKAKKIFLAVPTSYKRPFAVKWEIERARFVSLVKRKYGNQIDVIDCEDNGPGTKLLGLLERAAESNCLSSKDIIIAVDDDIIYSDDLVRLHELCHDLYQCDVGVVDQNDVVASWIPLKFKRHNALFSDEPRCTVFGWLSFSIRYDKTKDLPGFFSEALAHIPNALYADDGVFSAYLAKFRLYVTNIKCAPLGNLSRTELDEAKWGALRKESFSHHTVRTQVEKDLENYIYDPARPMEPKFRVPPHISPRSILNCSRLNFSQNPDMHLSAHFVADDQALITITVFASALIGSEVEIEFQLSSDFFRFPIRIESPKFTIVVQTRRPLFERLNDHAELPIVQTNSNALVSQNKFYSICTILNNAPTHAYVFYDEDARAQFVEQHCSDIVVKALHSLIPAAFRSDLFRYIFAYLNACIYFDVKMILHMPISAVYDLSQSDQLFVKDDHPGAVYNAFFINWRPKAEVFKYVIVLCLDRIIWNEYGDCTLSVTGPTVLGLAKRRDDGAEEKLFKVSEAGDWQNSVIRDRTGTIIISCSYPGYYEENDYIGKYHYGTLWEKRRVFRFSPPVFFPYYIRGEENILKGVDHVLWINLAEAKQRREETEFILSLFSELPHTRIEAVDGRTALPLAHDGSAVDANALPAEIACCLSHLKALAAAASLTGEYFLILEDDISLRFFPFHDSRDALGQIMERAPRDWEVIVLSRAHTSELYKEFTDWQRAFDDGFHIAGTVAYLVNRSGLEKIHELFKLTDGLFSIRKPEGQRVLVEQNKRWFVADVYIYSHLKTYIYKNMIFATRNKDSYIHPDHLEWHVQAQDVTFNHISEDVILREDCIVERHMYTDRGGSTEHKRLMPDLPATASQHNPT